MTEERKDRENRRSLREKKLIYGGYKFEQLCTLKRPPPPIGGPVSVAELASRNQEPINNSESFVSMFESRLESHMLLLAAEIDCVHDTSGPVTSTNYLEFKTTRVLKGSNDRVYFEKNRLLKYWAQSYLANVPRILCGYRNEAGNIVGMEMFETLKIPRIVRGKPHAWDGNVCLNFTDQFLSWLDQKIDQHDDPSFVWTITFQAPFNQIILKREQDRKTFLPSWYISEMNRIVSTTPVPSMSQKSE